MVLVQSQCAGAPVSLAFSPQLSYVQLVVTVLSHCCNSRTDSGEAKVESHASSETRPCQTALLLDTLLVEPGSQSHQCVGGITCVASWVSWSQLAATQSGIEPGSVVTPQALQCLRPLLHSGCPKSLFNAVKISP